MKKRGPKVAIVVGVVGVTLITAAMWRVLPRTRDLGNGYVYMHFPAGGHRYIVAKPEGIKKVGQEVLEYRVEGTMITGMVRRALGGNDVRGFTLDTKSHVVTFEPPLE